MSLAEFCAFRIISYILKKIDGIYFFLFVISKSRRGRGTSKKEQIRIDAPIWKMFNNIYTHHSFINENNHERNTI